MDVDGLAFKGSMLQLQLYVNRYPELLEAVLAQSGLTSNVTSQVKWVSPLKTDGYREHQDAAFLEMLGLGKHSTDLAEFWPSGGPCWDALGLARNDRGEQVVLLVEAKSYPEEVTSSFGAKAETSISKINSALSMTADWLGLDVVPPILTTGRYQAANRLAHHYFLSELCDLNSALVFVCFTDDPTHSAGRAVGIQAWMKENEHLWKDMGLGTAPLNTHFIYLPGIDPRSVASG